MNKAEYSIGGLSIFSVQVSDFSTNCYIVADKTGRALVIDPGDEAADISRLIDQAGLKPELIVLTHTHIDHLMAAGHVKRTYKIGLAAHFEARKAMAYLPLQMKVFGFNNAEIPVIDTYLKEGDMIFNLFRVIHTPGHSPDAICLYSEGLLFSGDTLFAGSIGRTDLPGGDYDLIINSIKDKILVLPPDTSVFPGHGNRTTIGCEKKENIYL